MSYFGITTCSKCGQKVSLTPELVIIGEGSYRYYCRRCKIEAELPNDFAFKTPVGKDLTIEEALKVLKRKKRFAIPGWLKKLLTKDP